MAKIFWVSFLSYPVCDTLTCYLGSFSTVCLGFPGGSDSKESACNAGDLGLVPGLGRSPGEGNGYPWTEEPGGLQFTGLQRVGHNLATNTFPFLSKVLIPGREKSVH